MGYEPMNESWQMAGERHETLGQYVAKTYLWMFAGLLVTFGIALAGYVTGAILYVFQVPYATDRKSTRLNSSHVKRSRMPSSA